MNTAANPLSQITTVAVDSAARLTRISMDSAERAIAVNLEYAKGALDKVTQDARALTQARDMQELLAVRTRIAESTLESMMGFSRSLYEIAAETQSELGKLAEERMSSFQQSVTDTVDQASKSAPAGSDVALAAIKSSLAATSAAFDSFNKAAKRAATLADAGMRSTPAKPRKK
ncbi:MAG TPA: phasin family protein [Usitatibacter sp.]|nr:phasin family protein [Usitatibacter sp.]